MDEEVGRLNSPLVIKDPENGAEQVLHGGSSGLYLANRLRDLDHSFENATDLPDVRTHPLRTTHYPQGRDDFTNNLSVARSNGNAYRDYLSKVKVSVPLLIKFVLEHGESNVARDGELVHNDLNVADGADGGGARDQKGTVKLYVSFLSFSTQSVPLQEFLRRKQRRCCCWWCDSWSHGWCWST